MEKEETNIDNLKENYEKISKKYALPSFDDLNRDFDIGKIDYEKTETILRDIRKVMVSKISSILQFVENLLNPSSNNMFFMFLVKGINQTEKEKLNLLFQKLGSMEIEAFNLEIDYSEKKEAGYIKSCTKEWPEIKEILNSIINSLKENWDKKKDKKNKSYYG